MRVAPSATPRRRQLSRKACAKASSCERAGDGAGGVIGLIAGRAEQHMQGVADDLGDRAFVRKDDIRHAGQIFVEDLAEHAWLERLDEAGEAGDVGEQRRDLAAPAGKVDPVGIAGEPLGEVGREVARQRRMRPLRRRLPPPRLAQDLEMAQRLGDRRFEIGESRSAWSRKSKAPRFIAVRMLAMSP